VNGDELLDRATRALRETTAAASGETEVAATTLARLDRSLGARGASRRVRGRFVRWMVMPMAASFLVFAAWASASGRLAHWVSLRSHEDAEHATPPTGSLPSTPPAPRLLPAAPVSVASRATTPSLEEVPPTPTLTPSPTPETSASARRALRPAPAQAADVDALYREAHDAHFVRRDPAAALAAWDRYLAAAGPGGRFTLEARYNRALSLVRLGRREEAAAALQAFARGEYGGYRRDEATELLRTLE
jgi:hypothetical protein